MYLNAVYYGDGRWGDRAASEAFFGKPPAALDWAEACSLAFPRPRRPTIRSGTSPSPGTASGTCWTASPPPVASCRAASGAAYAELTSLNR